MSDLLSEAEAEPDEPSRSKLEPYADVIAVLRRKRKSYVKIAEFLTEKAKIKGGVNPSTVFDFVKAEKKRGHRGRSAAPPIQEAPATPSVPLSPTPLPPNPIQKRAVYVPPSQTSKAFDPDALKTNDQVDDES